MIPSANRVLWVVLAFTWSAFVLAADIPKMKTTGISRTAQTPVIDGVLTEAEWAGAVVVDDLHGTVQISVST